MSATSPPDQPTDVPVLSTDASLLQRYRAGEGDAATELYRRYAERLFSLATAQTSAAVKGRVDPEDIVQSVFRTFFRRAALGQYEVPNGEELWKLFLVIGLNKIRALARHHKAAKRDARMTTGGIEFDTVADLTAAPDNIALHALQVTIDELLAPLPQSYQDVIRLRIEGCEVSEIAARTGRARRSVERMLEEFRQKLHGLLHDPS